MGYWGGILHCEGSGVEFPEEPWLAHLCKCLEQPGTGWALAHFGIKVGKALQDQIPQCHIHTAQTPPGTAIPCPSKEILPNTPSKAPLVQPEAVSSHPDSN